MVLLRKVTNYSKEVKLMSDNSLTPTELVEQIKEELNRHGTEMDRLWALLPGVFRATRLKRGIYQTTLANLVDKSYPAISTLERLGSKPQVSVETLEKLANILEGPIEQAGEIEMGRKKGGTDEDNAG